MKLLLAVLLMGVGTRSWGQGRIAFTNHASPTIDAPVFDTDCQTRLSGSSFLAQAYAGLTPDHLQPLGNIVPFLSGIGAGYMSAATGGEIFGSTEHMLVYAQLRAWQASAGATYEAAVAAGGKYGFSNLVPMEASVPPGPANLPVGLQSFCLFSALPPKLTAAASGPASVTLLWTVPSNGFLLQQNSSLGSTNWLTVTNAISVAGTNEFKVTVSGGSTFYRLVHPEPASP